MLKSEKKSLIRFLLIYLGSTFLLFSIAAWIFYTKQKHHLIDEQRDALQFEASKIVTGLRTLHHRYDDILVYPFRPDVESAIYDMDKQFIFGTGTPAPLFNEKYYLTTETKIYYLSEVQPHYLGASFLLVSKDLDQKPIKELQKEIGIFLLGAGFLFTLLGLILGRLFITPMRESMERLNLFIQDTTHELNTPISTILTNIEMLETFGKCEKNEELKRIEIASKTLSHIYDDLIYLNLNHNYYRRIEPINVSDFIRERMIYFNVMAENKRLKLEISIMSTSYLSTGYLDSGAPIPNTCSGPFQSQKRFKIDMQSSVYVGDNTYGKAIDMVFNLQPGDSSTQRYQVFSKINNYTGKRLNGYSIELLDANKMTNPALTFSLGTDIWNIEDLANWAHGLWGPATQAIPGFDDHHFSEPGFFDDKRVYYPASLSAGNTVVSYVGPIHGGNYQEMFGNWLPSKWHPTGILFDHDNNPNTEAEVLAFWGDPLGAGTNGWYKGFMDDWATPTEEELAVWTTAGGVYSIQGIEDTANLGVNYIVNIGDNAAIGSTFTIRIRPHFAPTSEQGTPSFVKDAPAPNHPGSERDNPDDGNGKVPAYDNMSLLVMIFGFLGIGALINRRKLV